MSSDVVDDTILMQALQIASGQSHAAPTQAHLQVLKLYADEYLKERDTATQERDAALAALHQLAHNLTEAKRDPCFGNGQAAHRG